MITNKMYYEIVQFFQRYFFIIVDQVDLRINWDFFCQLLTITVLMKQSSLPTRNEIRSLSLDNFNEVFHRQVQSKSPRQYEYLTNKQIWFWIQQICLVNCLNKNVLVVNENLLDFTQIVIYLQFNFVGREQQKYICNVLIICCCRFVCMP